ncbi:MAG: hypothetical protein O3A08_15510 [Proteobacteria bacterium]|nr:hypothetical protein [Pseudomonadota bacterium]MDA1287781.1 hypothetical protein [Pseudomonadota bacterium]
MTARDIAQIKADNVILATGSTWRRDGVGSMNFVPRALAAPGLLVLTPDDILAGQKPQGRVVVYESYD